MRLRRKSQALLSRQEHHQPHVHRGQAARDSLPRAGIHGEDRRGRRRPEQAAGVQPPAARAAAGHARRDAAEGPRSSGQRHPHRRAHRQGIRREADAGARDRGRADRGRAGARQRAAGGGPDLRPAQQDRAEEQVMGDAGHPEPRRLPCVHHHRFPGDGAEAPALLRGDGGQQRHGSL